MTVPATGSGQVPRSVWRSRPAGGVAVLKGLQCVVLGAWAMVAPRSFFDQVAAFEPYSQHVLQDVGAFQVGLGAVLLLADARAVALLGVGAGAALHALSHLVGRDLGGRP